MTQTDSAAPSLLRVLDVTGSTNDDARELARQGAAHGTAVAARVQTAGRGRRGHVWVSPRGSLYLSVVLRPEVPMQHFTGLPAVCALGVLDCLRGPLGLSRAALKWPNDLVVEGDKLAGVLVEAGSSPQGPYAVCGVGLNVAPLQDDASGAAAPAPASPEALARTCLEQLVDDPCALPDFADLAESLRASIAGRVEAWADSVRAGRAQAGPLAPVLDEYFDACPLLGRQVRVLSPEGALMGAGVFAGLDCWGRATVRLNDGREVVYTAEMVSLRPA